MPLSYEQAHKLQQWLNCRGTSGNCPMCGSSQWETGEIISGTDMDDQRSILPMVQVVCENCGYVMLFAAKPIGLV